MAYWDSFPNEFVLKRLFMLILGYFEVQGTYLKVHIFSKVSFNLVIETLFFSWIWWF
jgi:hypothetical protein